LESADAVCELDAGAAAAVLPPGPAGHTAVAESVLVAALVLALAAVVAAAASDFVSLPAVVDGNEGHEAARLSRVTGAAAALPDPLVVAELDRCRCRFFGAGVAGVPLLLAVATDGAAA
jgi:hypothetical protein